MSPSRGALVAFVAFALAPRPSPAQERRCDRVVTASVARGLFDRITAAQAQDACRFEGLRTRESEMELSWRTPDATLTAHVEPRECARPDSATVGAFALREDPALASECPVTRRALLLALGASPGATIGVATHDHRRVSSRFRRALAVVGLLVTLALVVGALRGAGTRAERVVRSVALATLAALPLSVVTSLDGERVFQVDVVLVATAVALAAWLGVRALRAKAWRDRETVWALGAVTALAVVVRLALRPSLANWYAEVLTANAQATSGRFGPGFPLLQSVLRAALPWSDRTITFANALVGALAAPLVVALAREVGLSTRAGAAAGVLLAVAPFHARISVTPSEHVLAATLALALMAAWVRAARTGDATVRALALVLVPCVTLTRADAWYALGVVALWGVAVARFETSPRRAFAAWGRDALAYLGVWIVTGAWTWAAVVVPSHHPMPERRALELASQHLVPQFARLAFEWPRWFPWVLPVLMVLGVLRLGWKRPWLLVCVTLSLAAAFVPLGRSFLHDELVGARYFLAALGLAMLLAGEGFGWITTPLSTRRARVTVPLSLAALGTISLAATWPAWTVRYTFEDEYTFLRRAASSLPAGCTVYQVQLRDRSFERDLDCCLDAPRSPLVIAYPNLRFVSLDGEPEAWRAELDGARGCVAYYQSAACGLQTTAEVLARHPRTVAALTRRCEAARAWGAQRPVATETVSARSTNELFAGVRPRVGLWIWEPRR